MARSVRRAKAYRDRLVGLLAGGPKKPSDLSFRAWLGALKRTVTEFFDDELNDRAASLTYYGILSIFPGLLVLVAGLSFLDHSITDDIVKNVRQLAPGPAREILLQGVTDLQKRPTTTAVLALVGLAIAFWSATGYIGAFMRAANRIYDVPEARPVWKTIPIQLIVTAVTGIFFVLTALAVVFTGRFAHLAGRTLGIEEPTIRVFDVAKWPILVVVAGLVLALLYWVSPNARQGGFHWITPGSVLALILWGAVSFGFAFYISRFDSYNKTYGTLGGVVIFLVWLWLTNVAVLIGAEFDAELSRARAIASGLPKDSEPYLPLRDLPKQPDGPDPSVPGQVV